MVIKVPTPIHGWRVFAGEVGVIVLGVLIALGAQQLAEHYSERERAKVALSAIRAEIVELNFFAAESIVVAPCVSAQLDALQGKLVDGATRPVEAMHEAGISSTYVVRFPDRPWPDLAWTSVSTNDGLQLLDDRVAYYARAFYSQVGEQRRRSIDATTTATQLNALSVMMPRAADSRLRFIESIEGLRSQVSTIGRVGGQLRDDLAAMNIGSDEAKIRKDLVEQSGTVEFCRAHGLPLAPLKPGNAQHAT